MGHNRQCDVGYNIFYCDKKNYWNRTLLLTSNAKTNDCCICAQTFKVYNRLVIQLELFHLEFCLFLSFFFYSEKRVAENLMSMISEQFERNISIDVLLSECIDEESWTSNMKHCFRQEKQTLESISIDIRKRTQPVLHVFNKFLDDQSATNSVQINVQPK